MADEFRCEIISWQKIYTISRKLARMIKKSGFQPDIIVAIARGGYVPARILCDFLDVTSLASIRVIHYEAGATKKKCARLADPLSVDVTNMNVLIVDDVNDTGDTLEVAVKHVADFHPADVRVAVLHHKQVSTFSPDYYGGKILKWRWIIYPWAVIEDVGGLLAKMKEKPQNQDDVRSFFLEKFHCKIPKKILQDLFT